MDQESDDNDQPDVDTSFHFDDLFISFFLLVLTVFICNVARDFLLQRNVLNMDDVQEKAVAELIGTFETTVILFELNLFGIRLQTVKYFTITIILHLLL